MNPQALITETLGHIDWLTTSPHTIGHVVKLQAQRNAAGRTRFPHRASVDEILSALTSRLDSASGKGGHSDPTANAALAGYPDDEDETIGSLHHACQLIRDKAEEAHHLTAAIIGAPARTFPAPRDLLTTLNDAQAHLICLRDIVPDDPPAHLLWLLRDPIGGTAEWLHRTCEAIYLGTRLEERDQPEQKPMDPCRICGPWHAPHARIPTALPGANGRCATCDNFHRNHSDKTWTYERTEAIWKRAEYGKGPTPAQMVEARTPRKRTKRKASA